MKIPRKEMKLQRNHIQERNETTMKIPRKEMKLQRNRIQERNEITMIPPLGKE